MSNPIPAVPIGHSSEKFALVYLSSLLHWRSDPQQYLKAAFPNRQYIPVTNVRLPERQEINVNFLDLRPAIARRHNLTNFVLLNSIVLASVLLSLAAYGSGPLTKQ